MKMFDYFEKGKCRILSDTLNWALYGDIYDMDLCTEGGFNVYYGDLYGSGEETFPKHMAHRSIEYQKECIEANREHVRKIREKGIAYIFYSSACTFDQTFFDRETVEKFSCTFDKFEWAFNTVNRRYACFNSPEWLQFQVDKTVMLVEELDVDGIFFDNIFYLNPCICSHCIDKYRRDTGKELSCTISEIAIQDTDEKVHNKGALSALAFSGYEKEKVRRYKDLLDYSQWRLNCLVDFFKEYRKRVDKAVKKEFAVIANGFLNCGETMLMYKSRIFDVYYSENGYSFPPETNIFTHKVGNAINKDCRRASVAVTRVLEGMPTPAMMKSFLAEGAANGGCSTPWGFFLHESTELKQAAVKYEKFFESREELFSSADNAADTAIVMPVRATVLKKLLGDEEQYVTNGSSIASRMLNDLHIPHDVVFAEDRLPDEQLAKYRMLIFPEVDIFSEENYEAVQRYASGGGVVLATGDSFLFDESMNCREKKLSGKNVYTVKEQFDRSYLNKRLTADNAVIGSDSMVKLILRINPSRLIDTTAAPLTAITLAASEKSLYVHCVNYNVNRGPYSIRGIPDCNIRFNIKVSGDVKEVFHFSPDKECCDKERLTFKREDDRVEFQLPELLYYSIIEIKYGKG